MNFFFYYYLKKKNIKKKSTFQYTDQGRYKHFVYFQTHCTKSSVREKSHNFYVSTENKICKTVKDFICQPTNRSLVN